MVEGRHAPSAKDGAVPPPLHRPREVLPCADVALRNAIVYGVANFPFPGSHAARYDPSLGVRHNDGRASRRPARRRVSVVILARSRFLEIGKTPVPAHPLERCRVGEDVFVADLNLVSAVGKHGVHGDVRVNSSVVVVVADHVLSVRVAFAHPAPREISQRVEIAAVVGVGA